MAIKIEDSLIDEQSIADAESILKVKRNND